MVACGRSALAEVVKPAAATSTASAVPTCATNGAPMANRMAVSTRPIRRLTWEDANTGFLSPDPAELPRPVILLIPPSSDRNDSVIQRQPAVQNHTSG